MPKIWLNLIKIQMAAAKLHQSVKINITVFTIAILSLVVLTFFSFRRFEQQKQAEAWVSHTFRVKLKIAETTNLLQDAESGVRGYLLTKDSIFLEPYLQAKQKMKISLKELQNVLADNPIQVNNGKKLSRLINSRFKEFHSILSANSIDQDEFVLYLKVGKYIMNDINNYTSSMNNTEDALLQRRISGKKAADQKTSDFILVISLLSLAVLLFSFFRLKNENQKRSRAEKSLSEINSTLMAQNLELEKKNTELASFTYIASHDLKEPLRKIETFASIINSTDRHNFSEKGQGYFDSIINSSKRMQHLIDSVFMYARTNVQESDLIEIDLNETVGSVLAILDFEILEAAATITYEGLPQLRAIPEQMEQLFTNLISNAIKYAQKDIRPLITIKARWLDSGHPDNVLSKDSWQIDVSDNGIGFDEQYKDKIFHIFQRLHAKDEYSGTGIGLAICKKIADNHNGMITVRSAPGNGSTFSIFLAVG